MPRQRKRHLFGPSVIAAPGAVVLAAVAGCLLAWPLAAPVGSPRVVAPLSLVSVEREVASPPRPAPRDGIAALRLAAAELGALCVEFRDLGGPFRKLDSVRLVGAGIASPAGDVVVRLSEREVMGAALRRSTLQDPTDEQLADYELTRESLRTLAARLSALGAIAIDRAELHGGGGGYHPSIVLRTDVLFTWPRGPELACREPELSADDEGGGPIWLVDPLEQRGCRRLDPADPSWWACKQHPSVTARRAEGRERARR